MNFFTLSATKHSLITFAGMIAILLGSHSVFSQNCDRSSFRSVDGSCNNLQQTNWGQAAIPFTRVLPADYKDGIGEMITSRPNPRYISNEVFQQVDAISNRDKLSSFVFTWGQFIDHDLDITLGNQRERASIPLPADEPTFEQDISFTRSAVIPGTGTSNTREHPNAITAWIDGSQVYGSDAHRANWLRTFKDGKLKTSDGKYLPFNTIDGERNSPVDSNAPEMDDPFHTGQAHFVAGDIRASEQPGLTILHTLFLREHNRICDELIADGIRDDERLYQTARKRVGALIQHITYTEFLPALGIKLQNYKKYNADVRPDITHIFATAAYRIGHTMVTDELLLLEDDCTPLREPLSLGQAFFNTRWIQQYGIAPIIKGLTVQKQELINAQVVNSLRNSLFNIPRLPTAVGLDLAAINIQRGRDHGLPDYNTIRAHYTGKRIRNFSEISKDPNVWQPLAKVYQNDINNIDPWVGMLAEDHFRGGNVGVTIYYILKDQFERARDGDFYYYENDPFLSKEDYRSVRNSRLSTVIENNTDLRVPTHVFRVTATKCNTSKPTTNNSKGNNGNNGKGNNGNSNNTTTTCNLNIQVGASNITVTKSATSAPYFQIFSASWKSVYSCMQNCGDTHEINNLKSGTYRIVSYDQNRRVTCSKKIQISSRKNNVTESSQEESSRSLFSTSTATNGVELFPNPAKQEAYLSLSDYLGRQATIHIYNNFGQLVRKVPSFSITESLFSLPIQDLGAGIYQVEMLLDEDLIKTNKMIIQH